MSAGLIGKTSTSKTTSPAAGAPTSGASMQRTPCSGGPYRSSTARFMGRSPGSHRVTSAPSFWTLPVEPVAHGTPHHQLQIAAREPWQLLREHRHALPPRAGHAGDVGAPEHPLWAEGVVDPAQMAVDVPIGVGLAGVARGPGGLDGDVRVSGEGEHLG